MAESIYLHHVVQKELNGIIISKFWDSSIQFFKLTWT